MEKAFIRNIFQISIAGSLAVSIFLFAGPAHAIWNPPTCNPDVVGPNDPTCNVSAPLNVSASAQTKAGQFIVQNTVSVADLYVGYSFGGGGTVYIESTSGISLNIAHGDTSQPAIYSKAATTSEPLISLSQQSTGKGISVSTDPTSGTGIEVSQGSASSAGITVSSVGLGQRITTTATVATGLEIQTFGSKSIGVDFELAGQNTGVNISNTGDDSIGFSMRTTGADVTGLDVSVSGRAANLTGTTSAGKGAVQGKNNGLGDGGYFVSTGGYGVVGVAMNSAMYGGNFCYSSSNCGAFGGSVYAGLISGRTLVSSSNVTGAPLLTVNHTNTSAAPGEGLRVYQAGTGVGLAPIGAPIGTALNAQAVQGYGVLGYSEKNSAGYFESNGDIAALKVINTSTSYGPVKYGIQTSATSPTGYALSATSDYGVAGQFFSNSGGIGIESNTTGGPGVRVTTANYTGAEINVTNGTGIVANVDDFQTAIQTSGGPVRSESGFMGGQFFASEHPSNGITENALPHVANEFTYAGVTGITDLVFDGSDIWIIDNTPIVKRINAADGRLIHSYTTSMTAVTDLVLVNDQVYVFGDENSSYGFTAYTVLNLYGDSGSGAVAITNGPTQLFGAPVTAIYSGERIYFSKGSSIYSFEPGGSSSVLVANLPSGLSAIIDMVNANGYIWGSSYSTDTVLKIDPDYIDPVLGPMPGVIEEIAVGNGPRGMEYDGQNVWVANYLANTVTQINLSTYAIQEISGFTRPYDLTFDGVYLWSSSYVTNSSILEAYHVASGTHDVNKDVFIGRLPSKTIFDGTNIWVVRNFSGTGGGHSLVKVATGQGQGYAEVDMRKGFFMYGSNNDLYCIYINGSGNLIANASNFGNCQN